ncbi:MAG: DUF2399 domain-containing protein [Myxococcaceae bacterium]
MRARCPLCSGACTGADLNPLLDCQLAWLWDRIATAADRRGDPDLAEGTLQVRAPQSPEERAAACGLLGGRVLSPGQSRRVDLAELTLRLRARGPHLTPGAVAAHASRRALAAKAKACAKRAGLEREIQELFAGLTKAMPARAPFRPDPSNVWPALARNGWVARVLAVDDPSRLLRTAVSVLSGLPCAGERADRRRLATDTTGNPHALDGGTALAGLVLAILAAGGKIGPRQRPRAAWAHAGVDCDDVTGGLVAVGIAPEGWCVPAGAVVTLTPRVLSSCQWPTPLAHHSWVFVTENPSVACAAADDSTRADSIRLLCTSGTPAAREIAAIARLADAGWNIAVRADFDEAGLAHVGALLDGVPAATPWRMGAEDYLASLASAHDAPLGITPSKVPATPWDPQLRTEMMKKGIAAFEESLLPELLEDLRQGHPVGAATHADLGLGREPRQTALRQGRGP